MPRRRAIVKREIQPDPQFKSVIIAKFINCLMYDGKKSVAEKLVYAALAEIAKRTKQEPTQVFERALQHVKPLVEVKSRRVGGATYQVPVEVAADRALSLAISWLIVAARARGEKNMILRLAGEIMDAADEERTTGGSKGGGSAVKKREDTHRMAEANKAFSHYRW